MGTMPMPENFFIVAALITIWTLPWKGYALWKAAQMRHKWWFIAILVLNTVAILEIIYIFFVLPRGKQEIVDKNMER